MKPLEAIREKCMECSCGDATEIRLCPIEKCPLYPFRFGKNPNRAGIGNKKANANENKKNKENNEE